jgi:hypothetical protein
MLITRLLLVPTSSMLGTLNLILHTSSQRRAVVPKRCVATPWCVAKLKKIFKLRLMMIINN